MVENSKAFSVAGVYIVADRTVKGEAETNPPRGLFAEFLYNRK